MTASLQTEAILVGAAVYGEADRIVTLVTRGLGKVSAIARGARKSRTRFGATLAPFVVAQATMAERRDLFELSSYTLVRDFTSVSKDVVAMAHASYGVELLRELSPPRHPEPAIFELCLELLDVLTQAPPRAETLRAFELRLLTCAGFAPALDRCAACGDLPRGDVHTVDPGRGGIVCPRCAAGSHFSATPVRLTELHRLRLLALAARPLLEIATDTLARDLGEEAAARQLTHGLLGPHLHAPLRSLEFLRQLRRDRSTGENV